MCIFYVSEHPILYLHPKLLFIFMLQPGNKIFDLHCLGTQRRCVCDYYGPEKGPSILCSSSKLTRKGGQALMRTRQNLKIGHIQ